MLSVIVFVGFLSRLIVWDSFRWISVYMCFLWQLSWTLCLDLLPVRSFNDFLSIFIVFHSFRCTLCLVLLSGRAFVNLLSIFVVYEAFVDFMLRLVNEIFYWFSVFWFVVCYNLGCILCLVFLFVKASVNLLSIFVVYDSFHWLSVYISCLWYLSLAWCLDLLSVRAFVDFLFTFLYVTTFADFLLVCDRFCWFSVYICCLWHLSLTFCLDSFWNNYRSFFVWNVLTILFIPLVKIIIFKTNEIDQEFIFLCDTN